MDSQPRQDSLTQEEMDRRWKARDRSVWKEDDRHLWEVTRLPNDFGQHMMGRLQPRSSTVNGVVLILLGLVLMIGLAMWMVVV